MLLLLKVSADLRLELIFLVKGEELEAENILGIQAHLHLYLSMTGFSSNKLALILRTQ